MQKIPQTGGNSHIHTGNANTALKHLPPYALNAHIWDMKWRVYQSHLVVTSVWTTTVHDFFLSQCSKKVHGKGKVGGRWKWTHNRRHKETRRRFTSHKIAAILQCLSLKRWKTLEMFFFYWIYWNTSKILSVIIKMNVHIKWVFSIRIIQIGNSWKFQYSWKFKHSGQITATTNKNYYVRPLTDAPHWLVNFRMTKK